MGGMVAVKSYYRGIMLGSGALLLCGVILLGTLTVNTPKMLLTVYMIITGMGVGVSFPVLSMSSVHGLDMHQRGSANSSIAFFRIIGMTAGISVFGTIQKSIMLSKLQNLPVFSVQNIPTDIRMIFQPMVRSHIPARYLKELTDILAGSITVLFQWSLIPVGLALLFIMIMGGAQLKHSLKATRKGEF